MDVPPSETGASSSPSSGSRRRVSLPASAAPYPFVFGLPEASVTEASSSSSSTPTSYPSSPQAGPSQLPTSASSPAPSTRIFIRPPQPLSLSQPTTAGGSSRLHQRAKSSGYGGVGKGGEGGSALSRSMSTGGSALLSSKPAPAGSALEVSAKRARKMWTEEETQQLAEGCNKWGVGSWRAILDDPTLTFQDRSAVDLKDRFRTSFPVAYHQLYPGAKTHISAASGSDSKHVEKGLKLEKRDVKKKRPFTAAEDVALKAGYDQHGAAWALISKDPIFQGRKSIDLRDRFRTTYPELYSKAGFKPRLIRAKTTPVPNTVDETGSLSDFGPTPTPSSASSSSGRRASSAFGFTSGPSSRTTTTTTSPVPLRNAGKSLSIGSSADRRRSASVVGSTEPPASSRSRRPPTARRASFSNPSSTANHPHPYLPSSTSTPSGASSSYLFHPPTTPTSANSFAYPLPLPSSQSHSYPATIPSNYPTEEAEGPHRSWSTPSSINEHSSYDAKPSAFVPQTSEEPRTLGRSSSGYSFISDQQHTLGGPASTASWLPSHYGLPEDFGGDLGGGGLPWPSASDSGAQDGDYCISETGSSSATPAPNTSVFKFTHHPTAGDLIYSSSARGPTLFNLDHLTLPAMGMDLASAAYPAIYADTSESSFDVDLDFDLLSDGGESAASMRMAAARMQIGQQHQHPHPHPHPQAAYSDSQSLSSFQHPPQPRPPPPSSHQSEPNLSFFGGPSSAPPFTLQPLIIEPPHETQTSSAPRTPQPHHHHSLSNSSPQAQPSYHPTADWSLDSTLFPPPPPPPRPHSRGLSHAWSTTSRSAGTTQDDINLDGGDGTERKRKRVASRVGGVGGGGEGGSGDESGGGGLQWLDLSMFGGAGEQGGSSGT